MCRPKNGSLSTSASVDGALRLRLNAPYLLASGSSAGGRTIIRNVLYQAAIVAARHHPELSEVAANMKARGKPHKLVITAIARRLITLANQIVKRDAPWQKRPA